MHMAQYLELCDTQHGYMQGWVMLGIAAKLGFSVCFSIPFRIDSVLICFLEFADGITFVTFLSQQRSFSLADVCQIAIAPVGVWMTRLAKGDMRHSGNCIGWNSWR